MSRADEPPYPSGGYAAYVVCVLFLAFVMAYLDRQIVTLLLPSLKVDLAVSDTQVSLIQGAAFASVFAVAGLPVGWFSDRTNRRNLLIAGIAIWSLATMACGLATSFWQLFAARMVVGLGEACLSPACVSMMADYFRPAQRGRAMSALQAGAPIGAASSLFFGGMLLSALAHGEGLAHLVPQGWATWKVVFLVIGAPGLVVAMLVATLKEPPRRINPQAEAAQGPSTALTAYFRAHARTLTLFFATAGCMFVLSYAMGSWGPTVLMRIYGMTPREAGATYGTMLLASSVGGGLLSGFVADGFVKRWPLSGRLLVPIIGLPIEIMALIAFATADSRSVIVPALAVSSFTTAFSAGMWHPAIQDLAPNQLRGRMIAVFLLIGNVVGLGCAPTLVALVTDHVFHDEMMLQKAVGVVALSAAALAWLLALMLPKSYASSRRAGHASQPAAPLPPADPAAATIGGGV